MREMAPWTSGTWRITLSNGAELSASRDRVRNLKALVGLSLPRVPSGLSELGKLAPLAAVQFDPN
jgi:hypothetical protein